MKTNQITKIVLYVLAAMTMMTAATAGTLTTNVGDDLLYNTIAVCLADGSIPYTADVTFQKGATFDTTTLVVDDTNNRVGIGTATPTQEVEIENAGTGNGLFIDQNGDGVALQIDSEATSGTSYGLSVDTGTGGASPAILQTSANDFYFKGHQAHTTGANWFYRNLAAGTTAAPLVFIEQDEATDDQTALLIQQDGLNYGLNIDQNADFHALNIDSEATTSSKYALNILSDQGGSPAIFSSNANANLYLTALSNTNGMIYGLRNLDAALTNGPLMKIKQDHATDDQTNVILQQDGTGTNLYLDTNGAGYSAIFDGGNVGIGTTTPNATLAIEGTQSMYSSGTRRYTVSPDFYGGAGRTVIGFNDYWNTATDAYNVDSTVYAGWAIEAVYDNGADTSNWIKFRHRSDDDKAGTFTTPLTIRGDSQIIINETTTGGNARTDLCIGANNEICRCGQCS